MLLKKHAVPLQQVSVLEVRIAKLVVTVADVNIVNQVEHVVFALPRKRPHQRESLWLKKHQVSVLQLQRKKQDVAELHNRVVLIVGSINFQC